MALTVWTLVTEVEEHLQVSNLIGDTQLWYVNSVKKTIAEILWQKINNNNEIVNDDEIDEIKHRVWKLKKPVSDTINEFLFYLELILRIEENPEANV